MFKKLVRLALLLPLCGSQSVWAHDDMYLMAIWEGGLPLHFGKEVGIGDAWIYAMDTLEGQGIVCDEFNGAQSAVINCKLGYYSFHFAPTDIANYNFPQINWVVVDGYIIDFELIEGLF